MLKNMRMVKMDWGINRDSEQNACDKAEGML